ncbi:MAG TPA: cupin domain-containing protein [Xanthobacteraceae bacterium]|nr:cupin domain-containing protein [Xanthobacteraceae bacterium]
MRLIFAAVALMALSSPLQADDAGKIVVRPVLSATETSSGQPIVLPKNNPLVLVSTYEIPPGMVLPKHKHPYPRYGYVLAGTLKVTNLDTGRSDDFKPGDFILEAVDQWHQGESTGTETVKLLVIDMVENGANNTVLFK